MLLRYIRTTFSGIFYSDVGYKATAIDTIADNFACRLAAIFVDLRVLCRQIDNRFTRLSSFLSKLHIERSNSSAERATAFGIRPVETRMFESLRDRDSKDEISRKRAGTRERLGCGATGVRGSSQERRGEREWSARLSGRPLRVTCTKPRARSRVVRHASEKFRWTDHHPCSKVLRVKRGTRTRPRPDGWDRQIEYRQHHSSTLGR